MLRRALLVTLGAGLLFAGPGPLAAQDAWDVPSFQPPRPVNEIGLYLINPDVANLAIMGLWRLPGALNPGVRAGLLIDRNGSTSYGGLVGVDIQGMLARYGPEFPVDVSWTAGVGGTFNSTDEIRIPIGLSAGRQFDFETQTLTLYPYVHPRVGIDIELDDDNDNRFGFTLDLAGIAGLIIGIGMLISAVLGPAGWAEANDGETWPVLAAVQPLSGSQR
jgi:hypothetical protein